MQSIDKQYQALTMPVRPAWDYNMSKQQIEKNEQKMFDKYLQNLYDTYPRTRLNFFEHNLEVWRQLWRVVEMSDIVLLIADVRHPLFHFPTSLYDYVTKQHKKPLIFVLNKCDLVPQHVVAEWMDYFHGNFPLIKVVTFSSFKLEDKDIKESEKRKQRRRRTKHTYIELIKGLFDACKELAVGTALESKLDMYSQEMIHKVEEMKMEQEQRAKKKGVKVKHNNRLMNQSDDDDDKPSINDNEQEEGEDIPEVEIPELQIPDSDDKSTLTIGLVGHPNVGKSCVINALMGKTVVSTSYTPGHTKHLQTIPLSKHIRLCDCPGLVFPAVDMPRQLQVLCGIFPIAQLREPYSSVQYLCERIDVEKYYGLKLPEDYDEWSAWAICEAYAIKRGFFTTKQARPDVYRAANEILRDVLFGRVLLYFVPPSMNAHNFQPAGFVTKADQEEDDEQNEQEEDTVAQDAQDVDLNQEPPEEDLDTTSKYQNKFALLADDDNE